MLIRLLPEQASRNWNDIKFAIEESLPPVVGMQSDRMSNILKAVLTEELIVWVSAEKDKDISGILITAFTFDKPSGTKSLLLYCVYGYGDVNRNAWIEGAETIRKFAIGEKCNRIIGYSDTPSIIKFVESIGGETKYRFLSLPL
jgi:hypothetical protein